jgi:type I restriction-modification system DNA methylase subunit
MKSRKRTIQFLSLLLVSALLSTATSLAYPYQVEDIEKLSPKYQNFLKETQTLMTPEDLQRFLDLKNDEQRDRFIAAFRKSQRSRDNVRTLYLLRMNQVLDFTEEQAARIFPRVTRVEKEKHELNKKLTRLLRELRLRLRDESAGEEELARRVQEIKDIDSQLEEIDKDLEMFLEENLTVVQQAKYIIFHSDFMRTLRVQLEKARKSVK